MENKLPKLDIDVLDSKRGLYSLDTNEEDLFQKYVNQLEEQLKKNKEKHSENIHISFDYIIANLRSVVQIFLEMKKMQKELYETKSQLEQAKKDIERLQKQTEIKKDWVIQ